MIITYVRYDMRDDVSDYNAIESNPHSKIT
jgi:hypothetical protein